MSEAAKSFFCSRDDETLRPICIVHVCIFFYAFSFWLCQPVEPYLLTKLGGDKMMYGYVQTACNVSMLIGGPFIGWICDKQGANMGAVYTFLGGALSYFIQAVAWNVPMIFLSKVPYVFLQTMQCAQVCVSHLSLRDRRSEALGRLAMSYGMGMIAGSALGGFLGEKAGYQTNSWVACLVSLANVPVVLFALPTHMLLQQDKDCGGESKGWLRSSVIFELLTKPSILSLVVISSLVSFAIALHRYTLPNVMVHYFLLKPSEQGIVLAIGAAAGAISNIILVGPALRCLGNHRSVVLTMIAIAAACMVAYSFTGPANLWLFYSLAVPNSAAGAVLWTIFCSLFADSVLAHQVGTAISIAHAVSTAGGIVMPAVGNYIYVKYGFVALCLVGAALLGLSFAYGVFAIGLSPGCSKCETEDTEATPLRGRA